MKRAVIFIHGNKPSDASVKRHIKKSDKIICADGGTMWAVALGLNPHVILGDFDSITPSLKKKLEKEKIEWHTFPKDKDQTDSELALDYAVKKGYRDILVFGVFGSRIDHMTANLTLFAEAVMGGVKVTLIIEDQEVHFVADMIELSGKIGEYISLIPMKYDAQGITTQGLKWRLYNDTLEYGKTRGISNELVEKKAKITVEKGVVMAVHTRT